MSGIFLKHFITSFLNVPGAIKGKPACRTLARHVGRPAFKQLNHESKKKEAIARQLLRVP